MTCSKLWLGAMGTLLCVSIVTSAGCARKSLILREREQVWFLNQGDQVPADDVICMDKGTFLATFEQVGKALLERTQ